MKKIILLLIVQIFIAKFAMAQSGTGSNSDWKVPIPAMGPQIKVTPGLSQIIVPTSPIIPTPAISVVSAFPVLSLVPQVPGVPAVPIVISSEGLAPSVPSGELKIKLPIQQLLPPLPTISISPVVRMPSNYF